MRVRARSQRSYGRLWRYRLEAVAARLAFTSLRRLDVEQASALGGVLARRIGPALPVHRRALRNLRACFPDKPANEIAGIAHAMWDNLGRTAAELAHLDAFHCYRPEGRIEVVGRNVIEQVVAAGRGAIFVSGHLANWELMPMATTQLGLATAEVYRAANNPYVDALLCSQRRRYTAPLQVPKGAGGARDLLGFLHGHGYVAMLIDQRMSDGIAVSFFGRPTMTAPAAAQLARRFGCPIVPARIERRGGARFRLTLLPPLQARCTGDRDADIRATMTDLNLLLEGWIKERPQEWLWVHRRWGDL